MGAVPDYRVITADLLTNVVDAELPVESFSFGEILNSPGAASISMALRPTRVTAAMPHLSTGRTAVYVERDGVLVWGGVLWSMSGSVETNTLRLNCEGFWSLVRGRLITADVTYTQQDQTAIVQDLLDTAQSVSGGDMGLVTSTITPTGILRDRTYYGFERKNLAEAIEQLAAVRNGFDFRIGVRWDGQTPVREVITMYPATGRQTDIVLEMGTNVELLSFTEDAKTMVTSVDAKGAGEGDSGLLVRQTNAAILGVYPLREEVMSLLDVSVPNTLVAHAQRRLARGSAPVVIPRVQSYGDVDPIVGSVAVGDRVRVLGSYGLMSIDGSYRITAWTCSVDDSGAERVVFDLAPLALFDSA